MDFDFTESQQTFRHEIRAWLEANVPANLRGRGFASSRADRDAVARLRDWQRTLHKAGYVGMDWPAEYGGRGASLVEQVMLYEEMSRAQAPQPLNRSGLSMLGPTLMKHGTAAQKARHLDILRLNGATYASTDSDFLVSDNVDFHPTDVLPDADGSLLVVDTGGWYKLCCPSSQLAKPDVLGAIYRVKKTGAKVSVAAERKAGYRRLTAPPSLADSRMAVTVKRGLWNPGTQSPGWFVEVLSNHTPATSAESAHTARAAAEGIGRLRERSGVPVLLAAAASADDAILETSFVQALIDIAAPGETRAGLIANSPRTRRAALIALDQMDGSDLKPTEVVPFLSAADERLRSTANWILSRHVDWGGELAGWFRQRLTAFDLAASERAALDSQLHILTRAEVGQQLLADVIIQPGFRDETRVAALNVIAGAGLKQPPAAWKAAVLPMLEPKNSASLPAAVRAARSLNGDAKIVTALRALGRDANQPAALRIDALVALPAGATLDAVEFDFLRASLAADNAPGTRSAAAGVLARAKPTAGQLAALTDNLKSAGPLELNKLCEAFDKGGDDVLGQQFLAALRESKSARALNPGQLKPHFAKFPEATQKSANEFLASLDMDAAKQAAHLEALLTEISSLPGDIRRGQLVFTSSNTACVTCHEIGYVGGRLGPSLTSIGKIRTERDLLEAVIYPSASFVRSFEPMRVIDKSGDDFSGVLRKDAPDEVVLATGAETEVRIARADIADMRPGMISVMPQGLDTQLSKQELADLITFLKSMK